MKQKKMLTHFLLLGSLFMTLSFYGCNLGNRDYFINGKWIYINETHYNIEVRDITLLDNFYVKPDSSHSIILEYPSSEHPRRVNPDELTPPRYSDECLLIINQKNVYKLKRDEGLKSAVNFLRRKINNNTYTFSYTFTKEQVEQWISESVPIE
ncbi:MAG: hypothetical protein ACRDD8_13495 [Bacteroidales bacterium]